MLTIYLSPTSPRGIDPVDLEFTLPVLFEMEHLTVWAPGCSSVGALGRFPDVLGLHR